MSINQPPNLNEPITFQDYKKYLPTAFDDSLTLLEKLDKVIKGLNQLGDNTNSVISDWNDLMTWIQGSGLDSSVSNKLNSMVTDGTLSTIINQDLFNNLSTAIGVNSGNITTLQTEQGRIKQYILPEDFGAKGDGITDDTNALKNAIASATNGRGIVSLKPYAEYLVTETIVVPAYVSIEGNSARLNAGSVWNDVNNGASVPTKTILFLHGRDPINGTDLIITTKFVKDLRIDGGSQNSSYIGVYAGTPDQSQVTQSSCVNYALYQANLDNIAVSNVAEGLFAAEMWGCKVSKFHTSYIGDCGLKIQGQIVNNDFIGCEWSGFNNAVYVDGATYAGTLRRPEGCNFVGGFIGGAKWGVNIVRCLAFRFLGSIIDLNSVFAVTGLDLSDVQFDHCWIYCSSRAIDLQAYSTSANGTFVNFTGCNISQGSDSPDPYLVYIHIRQNGINFEGCKFNGVVYWDDAACGNMENNFWDGTPDTATRIQKHGTGYMNQSRNVFKQDGSPVTFTNA